MDSPSSTPLTNGSRYFYQGKFRFYYPFGNTPARDFLEYANPESAENLSILVLGCGDIRSCFYTIWKNFHCSERRFQGVRFMLNDRSSAVLARNILFLYLCFKLPKSGASRQNYLQAMWSIWFCHELLPEHNRVLQDALKTLLAFSDDWASPNNPLNRFIDFFPSSTLTDIRKTWSMWYNDLTIPSVKTMLDLRKKELSKKLKRGEQGEALAGTLDMCGTVGFQLSKSFEALAKEYQAYLRTGSIHAESLFSEAATAATAVNPTFIEKTSLYNVHYGSCPFRCFQQTHICSIDQMIKMGMCVAHYTGKHSTGISSKAFEKSPLLANSFQQFSLWISATADVLFSQVQTQAPLVNFNFACLDIFEFSRKCTEQFDFVFASNVIDSVAPPSFILEMIKLVSSCNSYLLSATILHRCVAPTLEKYIESTFGFSSKLLPTICGIRCLNQEGEGYSSPVSHEHIPQEASDVNTALSSMKEKLLIWKKTDMTPLEISSLSDCPAISQALSNCFEVCCSSIFENYEGMAAYVLNHLCTDTAIKVLQSFVARLSNPGQASSYHFWKPLCNTLKKSKRLKGFLSCIQSQTLLCGIHFHLIVDRATCPLCNSVSISTFLSHFCIKKAMPGSEGNPLFAVYISESQYAIQSDPDAQVFDCLVGESNNGTLELSFLAPTHFSKKGYSCTLVQFIQVQVAIQQINCPTILLQGRLCDNAVANNTFFGVQPVTMSVKKTSFAFGTISKHCGNGDSFETAIVLSDDKPKLLTAELKVKQISFKEVQISCDGHTLDLQYPYPVIYDRLLLQRSRKAKTLTVKAHRMPHKYEDEGPLVYVNPGDHFSLPPIQLNEASDFLSRQYTLEERHILEKNPQGFNSSSWIKVKRIIHLFFQLNDENIFKLILPDKVAGAIIEVNNRVVDVHRQVVAVDLEYCFLDSLDEDTLLSMNHQIRSRVSVELSEYEIYLHENAYYLLKKVFHNFSNKTLCCTTKSSTCSKPSFIQQCGIEYLFKRAVVYPLYPDKQRATDELKCAHCQELIQDDLNSCPHCNTISYCSKKCRTDAWREHQKHCSNSRSAQAQQQPSSKSARTQQPSSESAQGQQQKQSQAGRPTNLAKNTITPDNHQDSLVPCTFCKKPTKPRRCTRCLKVAYCGTVCQKADWKEHRKICKPN